MTDVENRVTVDEDAIVNTGRTLDSIWRYVLPDKREIIMIVIFITIIYFRSFWIFFSNFTVLFIIIYLILTIVRFVMWKSGRPSIMLADATIEMRTREANILHSDPIRKWLKSIEDISLVSFNYAKSSMEEYIASWRREN